MKKSPSCCLLLLLFALPLFADLKDLTINADKVAVDKANNRVEAEGSVEATYKDMVLSGSHLIYDTKADTFSADGGFNLLYRGITFEGTSLFYRLKQETGTANQANFFYQGARMGGQKLEIKPDQYIISNAEFSSCNLSKPHYHVSASEINFSPRSGWMVAYWGLFWLGQVPIVPMPTYIYDFNAAERADQNIPPFPNIGYNSDDGNFVTETLSWYWRPELSGNYSLSYFSNKGLGIGGMANYMMNETNHGNLRLNFNSKDRYFGGVTHHLMFGPEKAVNDKSLFAFIQGGQTRQNDLQFDLSRNERINYQRVSFLPNFTLRSRQFLLPREIANLNLELAAGIVDEKDNTRLTRSGAKIGLYQDFPETALGAFTPSLIYDGLFYSNNTHWVKPSVRLAYGKTITPKLSSHLSYTHYLSLDGQSPFNYEMYQFRPADTLYGDVFFTVGETRAKVAAAYYLDNWSPQDIDYTLFFKLHCYNLETTYRSIRKEFTLGFSLASQ